MRILVVEDEFSLADIIATKLRKEKYNVDISLDGEEGLDNALSGVYDLIVLDIMLPKINGIEILKEIRNNNIDTKVIMLTAKSSLDDKLIGFENGTNDYITKPFHMEELIARVNVQLRNNEKNINKDILKFGDIELNVRTSTISCIKNNESINISYKELMILEYLMNNSNQIISKEQIYDKIWGIDTDFESNNLEAYLSFVRKKLKIIDSDVTIKAIRGMGYKLEA
ncbi:MAG: response regulator transcription factor [Bacilli bacterium]|nr:response regulator transcription factor [Bacilli bacterium]